jgi:cellulose synthase/poly-beta-1,6-N-acetylglucosamine synthase-like glycosyltransferase
MASAWRKHITQETMEMARCAQGIAADLRVIVPAFNEAESLRDTVASLVEQTVPPSRVLVVDDCSTDGTGEVAASLAVEVLRPPENTGSKAGAQTFALTSVRTRYTMAIDADTVLAPDAIELLAPVFVDDEVAAAIGYVIDSPIVAIPVLTGARRRGETRRAIASLPAYFALRLANCWFMLRAVVAELAVGRRLTTYEKGH